MRGLFLGLFGTLTLSTTFSSTAQAKPTWIMCYPTGLSASKKLYHFSFNDTLAEEKECGLGKLQNKAGIGTDIRWRKTLCDFSESWKQFDFNIKKPDEKYTIKVFKDLSDGEHYEGVIFGEAKKQKINQKLTCDFEEDY